MNSRIVLSCVGLTLLGGCRGRDAEPAPPFKMAGAKIMKPGVPSRLASEAPKLIVSLKDVTGPIRPGVKISCEVTLTVPSERVMPQSMHLELFEEKDDRIFDSCEATPHADAGAGVFVFRGILSAPKKPGRYRVRAVATDAEIRVSPNKGEGAAITPIMIRSPGIDVEVKP